MLRCMSCWCMTDRRGPSSRRRVVSLAALWLMARFIMYYSADQRNNNTLSPSSHASCAYLDFHLQPGNARQARSPQSPPMRFSAHFAVGAPNRPAPTEFRLWRASSRTFLLPPSRTPTSSQITLDNTDTQDGRQEPSRGVQRHQPGH